jgi:hypothetical protein
LVASPIVLFLCVSRETFLPPEKKLEEDNQP